MAKEKVFYFGSTIQIYEPEKIIKIGKYKAKEKETHLYFKETFFFHGKKKISKDEENEKLVSIKRKLKLVDKYEIRFIVIKKAKELSLGNSVNIFRNSL